MSIPDSKHKYTQENAKDVMHNPTSNCALIVFTRNPELGKCKTRLAATVGDEAALEIYRFLIQHTAAISARVQADPFVYYSVKVRENDAWDATIFRKKTQTGDDLGKRMENAFLEVFALGYERAIIIGSDMHDITSEEINDGFQQLELHDFVLGPAEDGGYYLLGMKSVKPALFRNKTWGTETVGEATLADLKNESVALLAEKNDVDYYEDIKDVAAFQQFLPMHLDNKID